MGRFGEETLCAKLLYFGEVEIILERLFWFGGFGEVVLERLVCFGEVELILERLFWFGGFGEVVLERLFHLCWKTG